MKSKAYILSVLLLSGCGDESIGIKPSPTPSPSPEAAIENPCSKSSLLGKWSQVVAGNDLEFTSDCKVLSQGEKINWSIDKSSGSEYLIFKINDITLDSCSYDISTMGGLKTPLAISLDLVCSKSGKLSYLKSK